MVDAIMINGGCNCDDITITGEVSSDKIIVCHCTGYQKFSGAPFRAVDVIATNDAKISVTLTELLKIAKSGNEQMQGFAANAIKTKVLKLQCVKSLLVSLISVLMKRQNWI